MESKKMTVGQENELIAGVLKETERFVHKAGYTGKMALHINLLVEEVLSMVRTPTGDFFASFWLESDEEECRIYVDAVADVDWDRKQEFLSLSKNHKKKPEKGIMAKIGGFFEKLLNPQEGGENARDAFGFYGQMYFAGFSEDVMMNQSPATWSLSEYKKALSETLKNGSGAEDAWDELEKSIIANLADDVIVRVKDDRVTMIIVKKKYKKET